MEPKWLGQEDWEKSFELVPRVAVNLLPVKKRLLGKRIVLLTKRAKLPMIGSWHMAGSFIRKGETIGACAQRVAQEELGTKIKKLWWGGIFDNLSGDPRGQVIDIVYWCELGGAPQVGGDTAEIEWFSRLPEGVGFGQEETLRQLGWG